MVLTNIIFGLNYIASPWITIRLDKVIDIMVWSTIPFSMDMDSRAASASSVTFDAARFAPMSPTAGLEASSVRAIHPHS